MVLKSLQAAVDDGDRIHAVIRGSALNNDGSTKMTYAAPNAAGQADVIAEAHAVAEIDASTVSYVETHGTGTPLGDPIEIEGLRQAFGVSTADQARPVLHRFGQVQHRSPGVSGRDGGFDQDDSLPQAPGDSGNSALHQPQPRTASGPRALRRAQRVRPVGMGWHSTCRGQLVRCRWHQRARRLGRGAGGFATPVTAPGPQVLLLSARTAEALQQSRSALAAELSGPDELNLPDVAYTLARRRKENIRMAAVVDDRHGRGNGAGARQSTTTCSSVNRCRAPINSDRVVFLFPGQGAQHIGMARGLYESEPVFAEHFDQCAAGFGEELGIDLRAEVFDGTAAKPGAHRPHPTRAVRRGIRARRS